MNNQNKKFWAIPIGEPLVWLLPAAVAGLSHLFAWPKAGLSGSGPGMHIALMNERTIFAQKAWRFVDSLPYPFVAYAVLLFAVFVVLRVKHVGGLYRAAAFILLAVPGLWYFRQAVYLGGKFINW
jgi:hypothetical protein